MAGFFQSLFGKEHGAPAGQAPKSKGLSEYTARLAKLWRENWLFLLALGAIAAAFLSLRTQASAVGSLAEVELFLRRGQPTFIEFFSNT